MEVKNRFKYWRHQLQMNKKEMAIFLEINYQQYVNWENHNGEPNVGSLIKIWEKIKIRFPECNLQDLLDA